MFTRRPVTSILLLVLAAALVTAPSAGSMTASAGGPLKGPGRGRPTPGRPSDSGAVPGRYIVVLKASAGDPGAVAAAHAASYGAVVTHVYRYALRGYSAAIPSGRVAALRANPVVQFVSPDGTAQADGQIVPTGVERVKAMSKPDKGAGVNVAVIDTGIDTHHPDLAANIVGGTNCSSGGKRSYDDGNGHGTHVAGIIAALDNGIGVVGVAPEAKLWAVRVLNDQGFGFWSEVVCGIDFVDSKSPARGGPITVANMSLGGNGTDDGNCGNTNGDALHQAICRAVADGVTFAVAAGNSGGDISTGVPKIPAVYDEVITVAALADSDGQPCGLGPSTKYGADDDFASFSNYATSASDLNHLVAAPGVDIYSTYKGGGYATLSGTSMATPHVAGAAALYIAAHPGASPASVLAALKPVGEPRDINFNGECGTSTSNGKGQKKVSHTDSTQKHPEVELRVDSF